jgi:pilus assembly protein CpaC
MLASKLKFFQKRAGYKSLKWASLLICSLALLPLTGAFHQKPAMASDLDNVQGAAENDSHFVRIGLNKSIVIRLPASAHDVIVGNPTIVDAVVRSKNTAYLFARGVGQTNVFFFDENGQQILNLDLEVATDTTALQKLLRRSIPGTKITVDTVNSSVVLGGTAPNVTEAKFAEDIANKFSDTGVVNTIKITGEDQVMLKVRIVEVQRNVLKQFGVDLQALLQVGKFAVNLASMTQVGGVIQSITPSSIAGPEAGYKGVYSSGSNSVTGVIRAMESDGLLKTLAEPNLTAISGQPAKFHAGGQIPYRTCTGTIGSQTCTVEFKDFGVTLGFTPQVLSEGRINLKINTEVSDIGTVQVDGLTTIDTRSAETVLELPSGGSMMLAGLIKDKTRQLVDGTPGLKKLPILGALFRSRDFVNNQTELVVIVTPYLVGSVAEKQLVTPVDNLNTATDRQTILFGRLNKIYGTAGKNPDGVYHGNVGFIVE